MEVGLGFSLGCLASRAMVGPGFGLAILGTEADQTTSRTDGEIRLCICFVAMVAFVQYGCLLASLGCFPSLGLLPHVEMLASARL